MKKALLVLKALVVSATTVLPSHAKPMVLDKETGHYKDVSYDAQRKEKAEGPLLTRWAKDVSPDHVWPEYPRPQMVRKEWMNLNGLWDFALRPRETPQPADYDRRILVPFPVESALSGVNETVTEKHRLWYRRTFEVPDDWAGRRILLNFEAVDWETTVRVNGIEVGAHRGGYDAFGFDITGALRPEGPQELVVSVWDPSDGGQQPNGKQQRNPSHTTRYTAASGIWQTVWLEPVRETRIEALKLTPDVDGETVGIEVSGPESLAGCRIEAEVTEAGARRSGGAGKAGEPLVLAVKDPKLWSPDSPFLYDLRVTLRDRDGQVVDRVTSYFGMRKVEVATAPDGYKRICLNSEFLFQLGFLDQGYWPDGIYTAPTDEALRYDIEAVKQVGCNMVRKHVKIEPRRWYTWCDRLGLLVWQDMVSGKRSGEGRRLFEHELRLMVEQHRNQPCIVMWIPFNEGWGEFDTPRIRTAIEEMDPTRLVNAASGGRTEKVHGEFYDMHNYPGPAAPLSVPNESRHVGVLGEFGGLGMLVEGHTWHKLDRRKLRGFSAYRDRRTWSPELAKTPWGKGWVIPLNLEDKPMRRDWIEWDRETYAREYAGLYSFIPPLRFQKGLDAAVYTQLTDVENELNGVLTYDRIPKVDPARMAEIHRQAMRKEPRKADHSVPTDAKLSVPATRPCSRDFTVSEHLPRAISRACAGDLKRRIR